VSTNCRLPIDAKVNHSLINLSLSLDRSNVVRIANVEDLASSTGLFLDKHELLRGVSTDQHPRVNLSNEEALLCTDWGSCVGMLEKLLVIWNGPHIVEG